jgi:hypothetical protein
MRLVLVSCTKTKRDQPAPAADLYDPSDYFRKQRAFAQADGDEWGILSAEHGFVRPDTVLEPYETFIGDVDAEEWAETVADQLGGVLSRNDEVVITAGKAYADPLVPELEYRFGVDVLEPFRGLQIGKRKAEMARRTTELQHGVIA